MPDISLREKYIVENFIDETLIKHGIVKGLSVDDLSKLKELAEKQIENTTYEEKT